MTSASSGKPSRSLSVDGWIAKATCCYTECGRCLTDGGWQVDIYSSQGSSGAANQNLYGSQQQQQQRMAMQMQQMMPQASGGAQGQQQVPQQVQQQPRSTPQLKTQPAQPLSAPGSGTPQAQQQQQMMMQQQQPQVMSTRHK